MFTIDEVRQCPDQGSRAIVWEMKLNRQSRQQVVLQGNITMKVPLDDQVAVSIKNKLASTKSAKKLYRV